MSAVRHAGGSIQEKEGEFDPLIPGKTVTRRHFGKKVAQIGPCRVRVVFLVGLFSFGMLFGRVSYFATAPLWVDSIKASVHLSPAPENATYFAGQFHEDKLSEKCFAQLYIQKRGRGLELLDNNRTHFSNYSVDKTHLISPYYMVLTQQFTCTVVFGLALLAVVLVSPEQITERERQYPKWQFLLIGFSMAVSSILVNSATSGSKTAPYLQAFLMNFSVPVTFCVRFLILRKRPTVRKLVCACLVVLTEFVCMLPTIFPSLESKQARQTEGGGEGAGRVIWPIVFVISQVPYAIQSTIIEKVTKEKTDKPSTGGITSEKSTAAKADQIHMIYFLFWTSAFTFLSALFFFWTQVIPDFAAVTTFPDFGKQLLFNAQCQFGESPCDTHVTVVSCLSIFANLLAVFSIANLLRWSEGANFMMIVSTIRTPTLFLFWTLFEEVPFRWYPHASLSTWLSIGAIFVMLPAVYAYSTGPPEHDARRNQDVTITAGDT